MTVSVNIFLIEGIEQHTPEPEQSHLSPLEAFETFYNFFIKNHVDNVSSLRTKVVGDKKKEKKHPFDRCLPKQCSKHWTIFSHLVI